MQETRYLFPSSYDWLDQVFQCQAARNGGVIRRQIVDVEREVGVRSFIAEVHRRGFRLIRTSQHFIIICNTDPITVVL